MAASYARLPAIIEQLRSAAGEGAQIEALLALRQALDPAINDSAPCQDDFVASWLPNVLQIIQLDVTPSFRKSLAAFVGHVAIHHTGVLGLVHCTAGLAALLQDPSAGVIKEAVLAFACVLRAALSLASLKPSQPDVRDMWDAVRRLQTDMCAVSQNHQSNCVRMAAAKLSEHIVLLFTHDAAPSVPGVPESLVNKLRLPDAARLASEVDPLLRWLLEPLRPTAALDQPPSRLIAHIGSAWTIAIARPNLMGKLLPCLMSLAKEGGFLASSSPGAVGRSGGDVSVGNALRNGLAAVLKSRVPSSVPWRERIGAALQSLGAGDTGSNMMKYIERQDWKERRALRDKRPADEHVNGQDPRRASHGSSAAVPVHAPLPVSTPPLPSAGLVNATTAPAIQQLQQPAGPVLYAPSAVRPPYPNGQGGAMEMGSYPVMGPYGLQAVRPALAAGPQPGVMQPPGGSSLPGSAYGPAMLPATMQPMHQMQPVPPMAQQQVLMQLQQPQLRPLAETAQPDAPAMLDPLLQHMQQQAAAQAAAIITAAAQIAAGLPPVTAPLSDAADLDQMLRYVDVAVRTNDDMLMESLLTGLVQGQPLLLADLVLAHLHLLPPALPPQFWPQRAPAAPAPAGEVAQVPFAADGPAAAAAAAGAAVAAAAAAVAAAAALQRGDGFALAGATGLVRTATPPPARITAEANAPIADGRQLRSSVAAPVPQQQPHPHQQLQRPAHQAGKAQDAPLPRRSRGPLPPLPGPARPPEMPPTHLSRITGAPGPGGGSAAAGMHVPAQVPALRPAALTPAQATSMRQHALKRLMALPPCAVPGRHMRQVVLARFGARVPAGDATAEQLLSHALRHYHDGGSELALVWLHALFVQGCPVPRRLLTAATAASESGAGALDHHGDRKRKQPDTEGEEQEGKEAKEAKPALPAGQHGGPDIAADSAMLDSKGDDAKGGVVPAPEPALKEGLADAAAVQPDTEMAVADAVGGAAGQVGSSGAGGDGVIPSAPPELSGTVYETVLLALLERARHHAVMWHAYQLRRYSRGLRDAAGALQQQRAVLQPMQPPVARLAAGLEAHIVAARQLQANVAWAAAQGAWLQGEAAAMDLGGGGGGGGGEGAEGEGEELQAVPELADEVASEVEGVQASVQESMMQLRQWHLEAGHPAPVPAPPVQPPRPIVGLEIKELLKASPSLPLPGVLSYLRDLLAAGGKWPTLALSCAWDAIESRPPARGAMLELVLEAAEDSHEEIRSAAVRLLTSKLYPRPHLRPTIVATAALRLSSLMPPPPDAANGPDGAASGPAGDARGPEAVEAPLPDCTRRCALYMALCAKQPDLLPGLVATYAGGGPNLRSAISGHAGALALALGASHPAMLGLLRAPAPGSEDLLLTMLHALTDKDLPPGRLVDACMAWYGASSDPRVMVPVAFTLSRRNVIGLLPVMLKSLQPPVLKKLYRSLATKHGEVEPLFSASELLLALHRDLDPMRDGVPLKSLMAAVDLALHSPDIFPQPVMLAAIRAMEGLTPLPRMFMRTVIQALKAAPRLRTDIAQLLERLVAKQIWTDRDQWRGFLLCADHMRSDAYTPLLQLPEAVLEVTLLGMAASEAARVQAGRMGLPPGCQLPLLSGSRLAAYILQPAPNQPPLANVLVTHQMRNMLQRLLQVQRAQEAAAAAPSEPALKAEPRDAKVERSADAGLGVGVVAAVKQEGAVKAEDTAARNACSGPGTAGGGTPEPLRGAKPELAASGSGTPALQRGPPLTIRAEREAGAAATLAREAGSGEAGPIRAPGSSTPAMAAGKLGATGSASTPTQAGGRRSDDAALDEGGDDGGDDAPMGTVSAEQEAVEGGAGGGTNEFALDFDDDDL